jgi:hypothetical protein
MFKPKLNILFLRKNLFLITEEFFYFITSLLLVGFGLEFILPGFFTLYFNIAALALVWLLTLLFLLFYVRR